MNILEEIKKILIEKEYTISTAESCTGGGLAARLTSIPGSSAYMKGAVVAYSNEIKEKLLGVNSQTLRDFGAVSCQTVKEMSEGVKQLMQTDCSIATSGIAGPGGATPGKDVGTIWIAVRVGDDICCEMLSGDYGRERNVERTISKALDIVLNMLTQNSCNEKG